MSKDNTGRKNIVAHAPRPAAGAAAAGAAGVSKVAFRRVHSRIADACTILQTFGVNLLLTSTTSPMNSISSSPTVVVAQQLDNLANMAERVASPEFKRGFREFVRSRAKAANSFLTYRDAQGRLIQEWPSTGRLEILAEAVR